MTTIRHKGGRASWALLVIALALWGSILPGSGPALAASVWVDDRVAAVGQTVRLRVHTRAGPMAAGGERVWLTVDGSPETEILTGGDGIGFWTVTPGKTGLLAIGARTRENTGRGLLLSASPSDKLVLVEVESGLGIRQIAGSAGDTTRDALSAIGTNHRLIYVTVGMGSVLAKGWLRLNRIPEAPVIDESAKSLANDLREAGLGSWAVVGSPAFLEPFRGRAPFVISFEPLDDGRRVSTWEDIVKIVLP